MPINNFLNSPVSTSANDIICNSFDNEDNENYTDEEIERIVKDKTLIPSVDDEYNGYIFDFESWKNNCAEMEYCAIVICNFLLKYKNIIDKVFKKIDKLNIKIQNPYQINYYNYLVMFYWYKRLKKFFNKKHGFNNFKYFKSKVKTFNLLYHENVDVYLSVKKEDRSKLEYNMFTKKLLQTFRDIEKNIDYSKMSYYDPVEKKTFINLKIAADKFENILYKINDFTDEINTVFLDMNAINNSIKIKKFIFFKKSMFSNFWNKKPFSFGDFLYNSFYSDECSINVSLGGDLFYNDKAYYIIKEDYKHVYLYKFKNSIREYFINLCF